MHGSSHSYTPETASKCGGHVGISPNPKHFVLLLEYVNGGSLYEWLFPPDLQAKNRPVDISLWNHRIDIACQIAEGLTYLHTYKPSVAHMDMKCSNVLLQHENDELICKVSATHSVSRLN